VAHQKQRIADNDTVLPSLVAALKVHNTQLGLIQRWGLEIFFLLFFLLFIEQLE